MGRGEWAAWRPSEAYTVGIEEEVMLLDPSDWTLTQRADEVLSEFLQNVSRAVGA